MWIHGAKELVDAVAVMLMRDPNVCHARLQVAILNSRLVQHIHSRACSAGCAHPITFFFNEGEKILLQGMCMSDVSHRC